MENKRWSFKVTDNSDNNGFIVDTKDIVSVYDLLRRIRSAEGAQPDLPHKADLPDDAKDAATFFRKAE